MKHTGKLRITVISHLKNPGNLHSGKYKISKIYIIIYFILLILHLILLFFGRSWVFTTILIYLGAFTGFFLLFAFYNKKRSLSKVTNRQLFTLSIIIGLFCGEMVLRFTSSNLKTYSEKNSSGFYISPFCNKYTKLKQRFYYKSDNLSLRTFPADYSYSLKTADFSYTHQYNEYGIRERKNLKELSKSKEIILACGDSFTEGVGSSPEKTWVRSLENKLNLQYDNKYLSINAGLSGLDPIYSYKIAEFLINDFSVDYLILTIGSNDFIDVILRGGDERFQGNSVKYPRRPIADYFFAFSYVFRSFANKYYDYPFLLMNEEEYQKKMTNAGKILQNEIIKYQQLAQQNDFELIVQIFPDSQEFKTGKYEFSQIYQLAEFVRTNEIIFIDLLDILNNDDLLLPETMYWPVDGHFSPEAYVLWGEILENLSIFISSE